MARQATKQSTYLEQVWKVRLTLETPLLASVPANEEIFSDFKLRQSVEAAKKQHESSMQAVANGHVPAPVVATVTGEEWDFAAAEKKSFAPDPEGITGRSVFLRDERDRAVVSNHIVKGYLKEAARARAKQGGITSTMAAYIQLIDLHLFVNPRKIVINTIRAEELPRWCERPLRAQTPQGARMTLKSSEQIGAGATIDFEILSMLPSLITEELLREWLNYGQYHGLGEWRNNSNYGCFTYTLAAK